MKWELVNYVIFKSGTSPDFNEMYEYEIRFIETVRHFPTWWPLFKVIMKIPIYYDVLFLFYINVRLLTQTLLLAKIDKITRIQTRISFITNTV